MINREEKLYTDYKAHCPECGRLVDCRTVKYVRISPSVHYADMFHNECGTIFTIDFLSNTLNETGTSA